MTKVHRAQRDRAIVIACVVTLAVFTFSQDTHVTSSPSTWVTHAGNQQHTAVSAVPAQSLEIIRWSTPVDLTSPGEPILIHYGSPLVTPANTVVIPVKTSSTGDYRVDARNGADGSLIWSETTDYILPSHSWTPSYSPALTSDNRVYFAGAGGTVYYRDNVDSGGPATGGQLAFFGIANYAANPGSFNSTVFINTPITPDSAGNIYFGFRTQGTAPLGLTSGVARIDANGNGTWVSAVAASGGDTLITRVPHQLAPALSNDEQTLYVVVAGSSSSSVSYLVGLNPATLALKESSPGVQMRAALKDPRNGGASNARVSDNSSSSPLVGPDGDVYYGVLPSSTGSSRGWMLHFSGNLAQVKTPGAFGWDITGSIVPAPMVPSYTGSSSYLIFTKYNDYAGNDGGLGVNRIAILDPNDTMVEPHASSNGQLVMKEILTIAGPTPDEDQTNNYPDAVREWCINTAAVDPATGSIMVNSEDGKLYRWDLASNTLLQPITLSPGIFEAYTPTVIGPDGTVYAINQAILHAVGQGPLPDLTETTVSDPPPTVPQGSSFLVDDSVQNIGASTAGSSTTRFILSVDATISVDDSMLTGSRAVGSLAPNGISAGSGVTLTVPAATPPGTYFLLACADAADAIAESDETNNCVASLNQGQVQVSQPDLVETAISNPPAAAAPGTSFSVTDTTQNQSSIASPSSTTRYHLSLDSTKDVNDTLLTGSRAVAVLGAGASLGGTVNVTIPSSTTLATYFLLACADDTGAIIESSETNNCLASAATIQVARPDLVETALSNPPAFARPGDVIPVTDTTKNQGGLGTTAFTTRYYFSLDGAKNAGDKLLSGSRTVSSLSAGASVNGTLNVTIPSATALGTYFLLGCADDGAVINESDETNNCRASGTTIQVTRPDLIETSVSNPPAVAAPGGSFPVSDTAQNQGNVSAANSTTRFHLSLDTIKGGGDIMLSVTRPVNTLASMATSPGTVTVTVASSTALGTYFLLACADDTTVVVETNETNNCKASETRVQVTKPDLIETAVSTATTAATPGGYFSVTDATKNQGTISAGASTTRYWLSLNNTKGSGDILLTGNRAVGTLVAGGTSSAAVTVSLPSNTALATYFLLACADDLLKVAETNETNNCLASTSTVQVTRPDLTEVTVSDPPSTATPGSVFSVTDTVLNNGAVTAAASTTRYHLSLDTVKGGDKLLAGTRLVPSLDPGVTSSGPVNVTVPTNTAAGSYFLLACADDTTVVTETNESNNCKPSASKVTVGP